MWILLLLVHLASCTRDENHGDPAEGATKTAICVPCHGKDGNPVDARLSSLAGQNERYLIDAMKAYQDGHGSDPAMINFVEGLSERDLEDIAAFYASQHAK